MENEAKFGEKWNPTVYFFQASWNNREFVVDMPFKASTVRFNRLEAKRMKEALEKFLES